MFAGSLAILTAVLLGTTGVWVLVASPRHGPNRALAVLLILYAGSTLAYHGYRDAGNSAQALALVRIINWYELPAALLTLLLLDGLLGDRIRGPVRRTAIGAIGVATLGLLLVQALQPDWFHRADAVGVLGGTRIIVRPQPLSLWTGVLLTAVNALAVGWLARASADPDRSPLQRRQAALIGLGFLFPLAHAGASGFTRLFLDPRIEPWGHMLLPIYVVQALGLGVCIYAATRYPLPFSGWPRSAAAIAPVLPIVAALYDGHALLTWGVMLPKASWLRDTRLVWLAAFAVLVALAVVRYGLAGMDREGRRRLDAATLWLITAVGSTVFLLMLTGLSGEAAPPLWLLPVALASGTPFLARPLAKRVHGLTGRIVLNPRDVDVMRERVRVYSSTLRASLDASGQVGPRQEPVLATLRRELGLTQRDHDLLLSTLDVPPQFADRRILLGRYFVQEELGRGGQGTAYLARDSVLGRKVVVKLLDPDTRHATGRLREARSLSSVEHPNVLTLYDTQVTSKGTFLVLEHAAGGSLADQVALGGVLGADDVAPLARQAADALRAVHDAGIVHGDVKPANILLSASGQVRLADFGSARRRLRDDEETHAVGSWEATWNYMAPEQLDGPAGPAADQYALAAVIVRVLTGRPALPLGAAIDARERSQILRMAAPDLNHPAIPAAWRDALRRALAKDPRDRHADVGALGALLTRP